MYADLVDSHTEYDVIGYFRQNLSKFACMTENDGLALNFSSVAFFLAQSVGGLLVGVGFSDRKTPPFSTSSCFYWPKVKRDSSRPLNMRLSNTIRVVIV